MVSDVAVFENYHTVQKSSMPFKRNKIPNLSEMYFADPKIDTLVGSDEALYAFGEYHEYFNEDWFFWAFVDYLREKRLLSKRDRSCHHLRHMFWYFRKGRPFYCTTRTAAARLAKDTGGNVKVSSATISTWNRRFVLDNLVTVEKYDSCYHFFPSKLLVECLDYVVENKWDVAKRNMGSENFKLIRGYAKNLKSFKPKKCFDNIIKKKRDYAETSVHEVVCDSPIISNRNTDSHLHAYNPSIAYNSITNIKTLVNRESLAENNGSIVNSCENKPEKLDSIMRCEYSADSNFKEIDYFDCKKMVTEKITKHFIYKNKISEKSVNDNGVTKDKSVTYSMILPVCLTGNVSYITKPSRIYAPMSLLENKGRDNEIAGFIKADRFMIAPGLLRILSEDERYLNKVTVSYLAKQLQSTCKVNLRKRLNERGYKLDEFLEIAHQFGYDDAKALRILYMARSYMKDDTFLVQATALFKDPGISKLTTTEAIPDEDLINFCIFGEIYDEKNPFRLFRYKNDTQRLGRQFIDCYYSNTDDEWVDTMLGDLQQIPMSNWLFSILEKRKLINCFSDNFKRISEEQKHTVTELIGKFLLKARNKIGEKKQRDSC